MRTTALIALGLLAASDAAAHVIKPEARDLTARATWNNMGCVQDGLARLLSTRVYSGGANSPTSCVNQCDSKGYKYAGVEFGTECWCGNSLDNGLGQKLDSSKCQVQCTGDAKVKCGGSYTMNLFSKPGGGGGGGGTATGLKPISANANTAAYTTQLTPASASGTKYLWGHHMIGNTYTYTQSDWRTDITQAKAAGLDGFALNMGRDDWQPQRVADAYAVAQSVGGFKLFFSFDMSSFACATANDAAVIGALASKYANHPAQAKYQNKIIVSTFAGEACKFGQADVNKAWTYFRTKVTTPIYFMPSIFLAPNTFGSSTWMDGEFNWNSAWPQSQAEISTQTDVEYMNALGKKGYMAGVSPFFFTYYGPQSWNKNWIYRSDNWLLATRFEQLVNTRNKMDHAQLISWNDFGESHYVGKIAPAASQPMSTGWTTGFPHTALQTLIKYYADAWHRGAYNAPGDKVWVWSRPHPKGANPSAPTAPRPNHWEWTDDNLYAVVTLASPAAVTLSSGKNTATWNLPKGMSKLSIASAAGGIKVMVVRGSAMVKNYDSGNLFQYTLSPKDFNYNYFVAEA